MRSYIPKFLYCTGDEARHTEKPSSEGAKTVHLVTRWNWRASEALGYQLVTTLV